MINTNRMEELEQSHTEKSVTDEEYKSNNNEFLEDALEETSDNQVEEYEEKDGTDGSVNTLDDETEKEEQYNEALKLFEKKTSKAYKDGIKKLEQLGEWDNVAEVIEERKVELAKIETEENEKRKKIKRRILIGVGAAVVAVLAFGFVRALLTPNLDDYEATKEATMNSMSYLIPKECKLEESEDDTYALYSLSEDGEAIGVVEIEYKGDSDLYGDAEYDADNDEHESSDTALEIIPNASGVYRDIEADNSVYEVTVYANESAVDGIDNLLATIADSFDVDGYKNPRTSNGVEVYYHGDASAGVVIKKDVEGLSVSESFETVKGEGSKDISYDIEKPVTLKVGETSKVAINADGDEYILKVECSDKPFYKDGKFTSTLDEIMESYSENFSDVHMYSGSLTAGGSVDLVEKDDAYGGRFNVSATNHSFVISFNSLDSSGDNTKPASKVPGKLMVIVGTDDPVDEEDLMCMTALLGNTLANLNPEISKKDAYNEVFDAIDAADGDSVKSTSRKYKGISYTVAYSGSALIMTIHG